MNLSEELFLYDLYKFLFGCAVCGFFVLLYFVATGIERLQRWWRNRRYRNLE